ncbi:MAG TPA: hypothetical protein VGG45_16260 [Terracidiphilus sp.]
MSGDIVELRIVSWDKNGHDVPIELGFKRSGDEKKDALAMDMLLRSAWQAVWLMAQSERPSADLKQKIEAILASDDA